MPSDVSMSFKRLQAEKMAADSVIRELTPVDGVTDTGGLRDYLQNIALKVEVRILAHNDIGCMM
jgi:glutaredoxin 2